jgi:hypothetical protein
MIHKSCWWVFGERAGAMDAPSNAQALLGGG